MYEIGQVYVFDGVERKVIGMDGPYPVTTTDLGYVPKKTAEAIGTEAMREQIRAELEQEYAEREEALLSLLPLDKCNKEELLALAKHFGREAEPEEGKMEPSKGEILAILTGA